MSYIDIARTIPTIQAISLLDENLHEVKKKKKKAKDFMDIGTKNIVGINLIKAQADIIG